MSGAARSACLVAPAGADLGAIRGQTLQTAREWTAAGWRVHLLWCGDSDVAMRQETSTAGALCHTLNDFHFPHTITLDGPNLFPVLQASDRVLHALREMHEQQRFDVIEFPDRGGLGFRTFQAQQTGQAFDGVALQVSEYGLSREVQHDRGEWLSEPASLALDYMERYSRDAREPEAQSKVSPLVTVSVAYYDLGDFLEETLAFLARQTYTNLEVLVINDGSTDPHSIAVFQQLRSKFPHFRFLEQSNAGIGATRNRGLREARGKYFIPVDADNIPRPDMVERFVQGMEHNPNVAALTCYFLAFRRFADLVEGQFAYAYKPTGGPRVLGCLQNVYGDGNAIFRVDALRAVGGFETDRDTSFEDWEVFVKLANAGQRIDVIPDFLFYYRHRDEGFSRITNGYRNHQRVLRRLFEADNLQVEERTLLWNWLVGSQRRIEELQAANRRLTKVLSSRHHQLATGVGKALRHVMRSTKSFFGIS